MSWRRVLALGVTILAAAGAAGQAEALCIYRQALYAKSTVTGEFRESSLVIKGTVTAQREVEIPGEGDWTGLVSTVRVDSRLKGRAPRVLILYSRNGSGRFPVETGRQYLLFLNPISRGDWAADYPGSYVVNYSCGQSGPWAEVSAKKRRVLDVETRRLRQK